MRSYQPDFRANEQYSYDHCSVCGRESRGYCFKPAGRRDLPEIYTCNSIECRDIVMGTYGMTEFEFNNREKAAIAEAGRAAEVYLDSIGKYDFRELSKVEFDEFNANFIKAYNESLKTFCTAMAPF